MKAIVKLQNDGTYSFFFNGNRVDVHERHLGAKNLIERDLVREFRREFAHSGETEIETYLEDWVADDLIGYAKSNPHLQSRSRRSSAAYSGAPMRDALRSKVIRLAHQNPELRPHLLPILKTAAAKVKILEVRPHRKGVFVKALVELPATEVPLGAAGGKSLPRAISEMLTEKHGEDLIFYAAKKITPASLARAGYDSGDLLNLFVEPEFGLSKGVGETVWRWESTDGNSVVFSVQYLLQVI